jgi:SAM-dependent methyltransferase
MQSSRSTTTATDTARITETYYDRVNIFVYDATIVAHPYMDQVKAAMISDLITIDRQGDRKLHILDAGTGSGQLARSILGAGFSNLALADIDRHSAKFCRDHPELSHLPFHIVDLTSADLKTLAGNTFDAVCLLGVFHHVPPRQRAAFLQNMARIARFIVIGDEGIQEYSSESERKHHARAWYSFVITESRRRGIEELALLEEQFMMSDTADVRGPDDDFKESPSAVIEYATRAGLTIARQTRLGDWTQYKGGMYTALLWSGK